MLDLDNLKTGNIISHNRKDTLYHYLILKIEKKIDDGIRYEHYLLKLFAMHNNKVIEDYRLYMNERLLNWQLMKCL